MTPVLALCVLGGQREPRRSGAEVGQRWAGRGAFTGAVFQVLGKGLEQKSCDSGSRSTALQPGPGLNLSPLGTVRRNAGPKGVKCSI